MFGAEATVTVWKSVTNVVFPRHLADISEAPYGADSVKSSVSPVSRRAVGVQGKQEKRKIVRSSSQKHGDSTQGNSVATPSDRPVRKANFPQACFETSKIAPSCGYENTFPRFPAISESSAHVPKTARRHSLTNLPTTTRFKKPSKVRKLRNDHKSAKPTGPSVSKSDAILTVGGQDLKLPLPRTPAAGQSRQQQVCQVPKNLQDVPPSVQRSEFPDGVSAAVSPSTQQLRTSLVKPTRHATSTCQHGWNENGSMKELPVCLSHASGDLGENHHALIPENLGKTEGESFMDQTTLLFNKIGMLNDDSKSPKPKVSTTESSAARDEDTAKYRELQLLQICKDDSKEVSADQILPSTPDNLAIDSNETKPNEDGGGSIQLMQPRSEAPLGATDDTAQDSSQAHRDFAVDLGEEKKKDFSKTDGKIKLEPSVGLPLDVAKARPLDAGHYKDVCEGTVNLIDEDVRISSIPKVTIMAKDDHILSLSRQTVSFNNSAGADEEDFLEGGGRRDAGGGQRYGPATRVEKRGVENQPGFDRNEDMQEFRDSRFSESPQRMQRDSSIMYMGAHDEYGDMSTGERDSYGYDKRFAFRDQTASPVKNTAVHNVTGKPETRPGNFERHTFGTPKENLARANATGMMSKGSGEVRQDFDSDGQSRRESLGGKGAGMKLPPLDTNPGKLPPLSGYDTEPRSRARDKRQSLGMPRLEHVLPGLDTEPHEQEMSSMTTAQKDGIIQQGTKDATRSLKRQPGQPVGGRWDGDITGERLPRSSAKEPGFSKLKPTELVDKRDYAENIKSGKGREFHSRDEPHFPAIGSLKDTGMVSRVGEQGWEHTAPPMKTLFNQYDNFELSLSPPPDGPLPPVPTDTSFRMAYSTLPKTFDWDTPRQPPLLSKRTPSPKKLGQIPGDSLLDVKLKGSGLSMTVHGSSRDIYDKSARLPRRSTSKKSGISWSSSETSRVSSPAESVWQSLSEIWRRNTAELRKLHGMVALNFLPLTSAFTFSVFELPPQYTAQNAKLRNQGMKIKMLKKTKKIVMKFATKPQREAALKRQTTKPVTVRTRNFEQNQEQ